MVPEQQLWLRHNLPSEASKIQKSCKHLEQVGYIDLSPETETKNIFFFISWWGSDMHTVEIFLNISLCCRSFS